MGRRAHAAFDLFHEKGHAIHGTYETKHLGSPVSHGCVRISRAHATELFAMVKADGMSNTKVIVTGGGGQDLVARSAMRTPEWATSGSSTHRSATRLSRRPTGFSSRHAID